MTTRSAPAAGTTPDRRSRSASGPSPPGSPDAAGARTRPLTRSRTTRHDGLRRRDAGRRAGRGRAGRDAARADAGARDPADGRQRDAEPAARPGRRRPRRGAAPAARRRGPGARRRRGLAAAATLPEARELRRPGSVNLVEDTMVWGDRVRPIARAGSSVEPIVIDEYAVEPAEDPVIGPELAAARTRLGLSVDQLADRTRIRPHVIESIEVDDFAPCGGDFYARGHLRTLARVLGIDVTPLLTRTTTGTPTRRSARAGSSRPSWPPASHGSIRGTRGGPNWSVLIAAVMAVVLVWSIARLAMDDPVPQRRLADPERLAGHRQPLPAGRRPGAGAAHRRRAAAPTCWCSTAPATRCSRATWPSARARRCATSPPPVQVQASDGSLQVSLDGRTRGTVGTTASPPRTPSRPLTGHLWAL